MKLEATNSSPISIEHGKIENIGKSSLSLIGSQTLSTVNTATQGMASEAATPLSSGGFVAAFERANGNFYYQRFDANGEKVGAEVEFLTAGVDGYVYGTTNPSACKTLELSNGSVVIAVYKNDETVFSLFDSEGTKITSNEVLSSAGTQYFSSSRVVDLGNRRFAIDYTHEDNSYVTSNKMVVIDYDGNVVQSEFEYSNKRFNDRSDMFALGGNRIAMIDASIPDNIGFQTSKYELTFNILDLTAEEVIKRTDIAELDPDGYVNGIWTSPMTSHSRFQDMHFNLAKASDGFFVTFSNSSGLFIAKVDEMEISQGLQLSFT